MTLIEELKKYYADLLIVQFQMPKARAEIELYTSVLFPINQASGNLLIKDVSDGFNVDTAVGKQLDIIGIYVGLTRFFLEVQFTDGLYFGLPDYLDFNLPTDIAGLADYSEFDTKDGDTLTYDDIQNSQGTLPDDDFRLLLKLKIVLNHSNGSRRQISDSLFGAFGYDIQMDTGGAVMTMIYFYDESLQRLIGFAIDQDLLPKPAGVRLTSVVVAGNYLCLSDYNTQESTIERLTGLCDYVEYETKDGALLTYRALQQI